MSAPDLGTLLMGIPGKLCVGSTDLTTAWPHGGTGLGVVADIVVRPARAYGRVKAEEFGVEIAEVVDMGAAYVLSCSFRGWDDDALALFPGAVTGTGSGRKYMTWPPASFRSGMLLSAYAVKLVFTPEDTDRHPMVILPKTIPLCAETAEFSFRHDVERELLVDFVALRDATSRVYLEGRKEDLSL